VPGFFQHGGVFFFRPAGLKYFDSLAVDSVGYICISTFGEDGISVVTPDGHSDSFVPTPEMFPTNICFGGLDRRTAYITLAGTGKLVAMEWPRPGLALHWLNW
jgi:gluconolactonase